MLPGDGPDPASDNGYFPSPKKKLMQEVNCAAACVWAANWTGALIILERERMRRAGLVRRIRDAAPAQAQTFEAIRMAVRTPA